MNFLRALTVMLTAVVFFLVPAYFFSNFLLILACFIFCFGFFLAGSIQVVPADPPTIAILTFLGEPTATTLSSGYYILPFYPSLFGLIPIENKTVDQELAFQIVTPDNVSSRFEITVSWIIDQAHILELYLNGGIEGVKSKLEDIVEGRLREWSVSTTEGPEDWQEARRAGRQATAVLLKAILGDELNKIDFLGGPEIPTPVLMKYVEKEKPNERESKLYGNDWKGLENILGTNLDKVVRQVEKRLVLVKNVRQGKPRQVNTELCKPDLGIQIVRLVIGDIKPPAGIEKAAEQKAAEKTNIEKQNLVNEGLAKRIKRLEKVAKMSPKEARDTELVNDGKIKETKETKEIGLSAETLKVLGPLAQPLIDRIANPRPKP